jgi:hypothetical protein
VCLSHESLAGEAGKKAPSPVPGDGGILGWKSFVQGAVCQTRISVCGGLRVDMGYIVWSGRNLWRWSAGGHGHWLASGMTEGEKVCSERAGNEDRVISFLGLDLFLCRQFVSLGRNLALGYGVLEGDG